MEQQLWGRTWEYPDCSTGTAGDPGDRELQDSGIFQQEETVSCVILLPLNETLSLFSIRFTLGSV